MDNLKMHTPDLAAENFKKLATLFPNAVTETIDENGEIVRAIDADVLRQEISAAVVEGTQERYQFTWPDKKKSVVLANQPIAKTLRLVREKSVGRDGTPGSIDTENIYIEGDNLDALKLLQETYLGKVKLIYIDPPYNTGSDAFVYDDDFAATGGEFSEASGQYDEDGNLLFDMRVNNESNGRFHTDWLNMMYPRLRIAKDLLSDDGAMLISIDDNEGDNLKKICDEVFGASSFVANISWQRTYSIRNDSKGIPTEVEHLLVYSKSPDWEPYKLPRTEKMDKAYGNPDGDVSPWMSGSPVASEAATHQGMVYAIQHPFTGELFYPSDKAHWRYSQEQMLEYMNGWCKYRLEDLHDDEERARVCGVDKSEVRKGVKAIVLDEPVDVAAQKAKTVYDKGPWPRFYFTNGGLGGIRRKVYLDAVGGRIATNYWCFDEVGHTDEAKKEVKKLFDGNAPFDTPKPVRLMERILEIASDEDSIILDFFSGSASTAHAVLQKNVQGGHRKFIMVQLPEKSPMPAFDTLCDIGEERIRRAGKKICAESPLTTSNLDIGFRVFKVDSSNMEDVYYRPADYNQGQMNLFANNIKKDRTPEDLLFQVMLDLGVLLSSKIEETIIAGKKVFSVADGYLIACFDDNVTEETVKAIAQQHPFYAVFRDSGMATDSVATNFEQIFETYSPKTQRKVL